MSALFLLIIRSADIVCELCLTASIILIQSADEQLGQLRNDSASEQKIDRYKKGHLLHVHTKQELGDSIGTAMASGIAFKE